MELLFCPQAKLVAFMQACEAPMLNVSAPVVDLKYFRIQIADKSSVKNVLNLCKLLRTRTQCLQEWISCLYCRGCKTLTFCASNLDSIPTLIFIFIYFFVKICIPTTLDT